MCALAGVSPNPDVGEKLAREKLADGSAWRIFLENVEYQGGDTSVVLDPKKGPHARIVRPVKALAEGFVARIDAYRMGVASVMLGAGRSRKEDVVLPGVGITLLRTRGDGVRRDEELCLIQGESESKVEEACALAASAFQIDTTPPTIGRRVLEEIAQT